VDIEAGKFFVETLENKMGDLKKTLDESFKQTYKTQIKELFKTKCMCTKKKFKYQTDHESQCEGLKIYKRLMQEYRQTPVIGFNSGKYDLTFIIPHLKKNEIKNFISKGNQIMKLDYGIYSFIDSRNFLPPNVNLNGFAQMMGLKTQKEIMCYDWLDSVEKLESTALPDMNHYKIC
jgi:hypothetical protein